MMMQDNAYAVVFDVGSSCIKACIGQQSAAQTKILAQAKRPIATDIRRGVIQKTHEVSLLLDEMLDEMLEALPTPMQVLKVYIGLNAYGMRSVSLQASLNLNYERTVDDTVLDELLDEAQSQFEVNEDFDLRQTFVQEYVVDGFRTPDPKGEKPRKIDAVYKAVIGRNQIFRNLESTLEATGMCGRYELELGILASAEAVLTPEDKEKGVVVVDFGAQTTGICVIKGNVVRHVAVLPFGGANITRDLTQLPGLSTQEAEALKLEQGNALHYTELMMRAKKENGRLLDFSASDKEVNEIVVARIEEIVDNIWAQIRYAWLNPVTLANGLVITGGASRLKNLETLLHQKTGLVVRTVPEVEPEMAQCLGLMRLAKENCLQLDEDALAARKAQEEQEAQEAARRQQETFLNGNLFPEEEIKQEAKPEAKPREKSAPKPMENPSGNKPGKKKKEKRSLLDMAQSIFNQLTDDE